MCGYLPYEIILYMFPAWLPPVSPDTTEGGPDFCWNPEKDFEEGAQGQALQESGLGERQTQETQSGLGSAFCLPHFQDQEESVQ